MTIYSKAAIDLPSRAARAARAAALVAAALSTACDVEWGGASIRLENPAPERVELESGASVAVEQPPQPLPEGPLLFSVTVNPSTGTARAVPIARLGVQGPEPLALPDSWDDAWRARFDSAFLSSGRALELHSGGQRIGSLVLDGESVTPRRDCLPVASGRSLLPAGSRAPLRGFALASVGTPETPATPVQPDVDTRIRTFGPILAERLLQAGGETRPYLAQRADLRAVPWPGDAAPAMAATYLVNDQLDATASSGEATSLFFLARFDPGRGYVADWSELRSYGATSGREIFVYRDAIGPQGKRIDFVERRAEGPVLLAASPDVEGRREITWTEPAACPSDALLAEAGGP